VVLMLFLHTNHQIDKAELHTANFKITIHEHIREISLTFTTANHHKMKTRLITNITVQYLKLGNSHSLGNTERMARFLFAYNTNGIITELLKKFEPTLTIIFDNKE
jgi:hypothetical protein